MDPVKLVDGCGARLLRSVCTGMIYRVRAGLDLAGIVHSDVDLPLKSRELFVQWVFVDAKLDEPLIGRSNNRMPKSRVVMMSGRN
eukprot:m.330300 g.330300  ORF g.330300 m.330300 type:complete len:85 (-) comp27719_c0_seq14:174-428(-)